jgi:hypothetical protein
LHHFAPFGQVFGVVIGCSYRVPGNPGGLPKASKRKLTDIFE